MTPSLPTKPDAAPDLAPGRASLDWTEAGPRSQTFGDVYFSPEDGWAETEAVFLHGCGLPSAWSDAKTFTIGELGFGTGLNALVTLDAWRRCGPAEAWLHFVSVEGFPLSPVDAARALAPYALRSPDVAAALLRAWPPRIKGVHRRRLGDLRATLTLAWLPVEESLDALDVQADAWFLDGFAPAKNPAMWSDAVLARIARLSKPGARAASFTVAGAVRRGLEAAGFAVEKKPGFGRKRERLEARLVAPPRRFGHAILAPRGEQVDGPIAVIGSGLAGAAVAEALGVRGRAVTVYDAAAAAAAGASGNPVGLVMPRLDLDDRPSARLHRIAFAHAVAAYRDATGFRATGVVELAKSDADAERFVRLMSAGGLPEDWIEPIAPAFGSPALAARRIERAGVAEPRRLVETWLGGARLHLSATVSALERSGDGWRLLDAAGAVLGEAAGVVIASGPGLARFAQTAALEIRPSRGQITKLAGGAGLDRALVYGGYVLPDPHSDGVWCGATYDPWDVDAEVAPTPASDAANLAELAAWAPTLATGAPIDARASLRATTPDRLPYAGPVADAAAFEAAFAGLRTGGPIPAIAAPLVEGLWVLGGLGSRGLVFAPLLAEAIASEICGEPGALEVGAAAAVHPARVLTRALKRGARG